MTDQVRDLGTRRTYAHHLLRGMVVVALALLWIIAVNEVGARTIGGTMQGNAPVARQP